MSGGFLRPFRHDDSVYAHIVETDVLGILEDVGFGCLFKGYIPETDVLHRSAFDADEIESIEFRFATADIADFKILESRREIAAPRAVVVCVEAYERSLNMGAVYATHPDISDCTSAVEVGFEIDPVGAVFYFRIVHEHVLHSGGHFAADAQSVAA